MGRGEKPRGYDVFFIITQKAGERERKAGVFENDIIIGREKRGPKGRQKEKGTRCCASYIKTRERNLPNARFLKIAHFCKKLVKST